MAHRFDPFCRFPSGSPIYQQENATKSKSKANAVLARKDSEIERLRKVHRNEVEGLRGRIGKLEDEVSRQEALRRANL